MNTADDPDGIALPPRCIDARAEPAIEVLLQALFGSESGLEGAPDLQPQLAVAVDAFMRGAQSFELKPIDRDLLDRLPETLDRLSLSRVEGTRRQPESGYRYRATLVVREFGMRFDLVVMPAAGGQLSARLTIEELIAAGEFHGSRNTAGPAGVSQAFQEKAIALSGPEQISEQLYDLTPSASFTPF
ncbi:hypothetical protein [Pseudomonas aeruginosa]|nr:hypothetical protein [Pseudomonas aeruginosa]ELT7041088.1 hypothetical protein [Pseudomonas aeruginosa]ETD53118.1 hypothetical protein X778_12855 [Pseudomonas aeruginosa VRFPA07]KAA5588836.1 hypothetical protein F3H14_26515 [Pseudomonas aeruginosa]MBG6418234.1 hypothetical protein [Pseudomonas aeruginosa]MBH8810449.1 hypothetical protein [Pseudomonas aeruginosa]